MLAGDGDAGTGRQAYGVHPNSVGLRLRRFVKRPPEIFAEQTTVNGYDRRTRDLAQSLGKTQVGITLLKNFLSRTR